MSKLSNTNKINSTINSLSTNPQLSHLKLYRVSLSDLCWVIKKLPSAAVVLLYLSEHCVANVNSIQIRRDVIAEGTCQSEQQITNATKFLLEHNLISKSVHKGYTFFEINTRYISKGSEYYDQCYYEAQPLNADFAKRFFNVTSKTITHTEKKVS